MSSLSWHLRNPLTGGDSWDVSDTTVVKSVFLEEAIMRNSPAG